MTIIETDRSNPAWVQPNTGPGFLSTVEARAYGTFLRTFDLARRSEARRVRVTTSNGTILFETDTPRGTMRASVAIKTLDGEDLASTIDAAMNAGRYMPYEIELNGSTIDRCDFLKGADRIETLDAPNLEGVRIGVWLPLSHSGPANIYSQSARISVGGVPWVTHAPIVKTFDGDLRYGIDTPTMPTRTDRGPADSRPTSTKPIEADVWPFVGTPEQLVLLRRAMREAGYRLLAEGSVHDEPAGSTRGAPMATRADAAKLGIPIPEPTVRLREWERHPARRRPAIGSAYATRPTTGRDTVVIDLMRLPTNDPAGAAAINRATLERAIVEAFTGKLDARCADPSLSGTQAYDSLPVVRGVRVVCRDHPTPDNPSPAPVDASTWASTRSGPGGPRQPHRLELELDITENCMPALLRRRRAQPEHTLPLPFALLPPRPGAEPGPDCILVTAEPWPKRQDPEVHRRCARRHVLPLRERGRAARPGMRCTAPRHAQGRSRGVQHQRPPPAREDDQVPGRTRDRQPRAQGHDDDSESRPRPRRGRRVRNGGVRGPHADLRTPEKQTKRNTARGRR